MNRIMEGIRGVVGVSGVIIWEKESNTYHRLLPARFDDAIIQKLCEQLARFCRIREKSFQSIARFQKGWLLVHNHDAFALMVIAKNDLNTTTLNLVIRTSVTALQSTLETRSASSSAAVGFEPEHAPVLARAINLSLGYLQQHISRFEIAELLRQAKSELLAEYPSLKHFSVDANGGVILIRNAEKHLDMSAVAAAARLIAALVDRAGNRINTDDFDIVVLTAPLRETLLELGFYRAFKDFTKSKV